jgi:uncharacterized protein (TIGR02118 family)
MVRLIGLWTPPADAEAFDHEYLGTHLPKLERLPESRGARTSRAFDGPYFRMTEVDFVSVDDINAALATDIGQQVLHDAHSLAEKYGLRLDVLVVAEPT